MKSLVYQIAQASPDGWKLLREEYTRPGAKGSWTHTRLFTMLRQLLANVGPTIVVIDALDECFSNDPRSSGTQEDMLDFLRDLHNLNLPTFHLLVTSRPEPIIVTHLDTIQPMKLYLKELPNHREDMEKYINDKLSGPVFRHWAEPMREKVKAALSDMKKSQGM